MSKRRAEDLAAFGGKPLFDHCLHVGQPSFGSLGMFYERLRGMFDRQWVTNDGPLVREFEERIALLLGVKHCISTCNGTMALSLVTRALHMGNEVILPSFTFIATAHALQWQGIKPVFCDVTSGTCTIDPEQVESLITPSTSGIIGLHTFGKPCNVGALEDIANAHNIPLVFDAAHAFGVTVDGKYIGNFGNAEIFSFHATKAVHAFEGGAVVTNDNELAAKLRLMRNFGFDGYDNVVYEGVNGKMTEVCAAMGLCSLDVMSTTFEANRRNYTYYKNRLNALGLECLSFDESEKNNWQYVACLWDERKWGLSRDRMIELLHAENILARRYFYPGCHRMPFYMEQHPGLQLPATERLAERIVLLPAGQVLPESAAVQIMDFMQFLIEESSSIQKKMDSLATSKL